MDRSNNKIYIFISLALGVLFILILTIYLLRKKRVETIPPTEFPTPTSIEQLNVTPIEELTPGIVHPTGFTGVLEETLPPELKALSEQYQTLIKKTPLTESQFQINFDYGEDKFVVTLKEPKDEARTSFENWLKDNYPAIPLDRFILK